MGLSPNPSDSGPITDPRWPTPPPVQEPKPRGFAALDEEAMREIASQGGKASQKSGRGHRFTREEAIEAGRKGGSARRAKKG